MTEVYMPDWEQIVHIRPPFHVVTMTFKHIKSMYNTVTVCQGIHEQENENSKQFSLIA